MKIDITKVAYVALKVNPRYPEEDGYLNGKVDENNEMPFLDKRGCWHPVIEMTTGKIIGWPTGMTAQIHYKICDDGSYYLRDINGNVIAELEDDYVPDFIPGEYGDYIIMSIDADGVIAEWPKNLMRFKFDNWNLI